MAKVGKKTGKKTQAGKDVYKTPEGKNVSEISRTFKYKGKWINVPSIHKGREYDQKTLKLMLEAEVIKPTSTHDSRTEAEAAARDRSDRLKFDEGGLATEEERLGFVKSYGVEPVTDINTDLTFKDAAKTVAEMTPIIGDAMAAKEVYDELNKDEPNYGLIAALGGAALVGAVPGIGDAAAAGIRKAVDVAKRVEVDPDAVGMMGGNIRIKPKEESVWSYPEQLYDSADTSINVSKKPAGYNELKKRGEIKDGDVIVDIGGGRFDNLVEDAAEEGATVKVYDPFNRTPEHNAAVVESVKDGQADMAMSHNVLNVIQEDKNIIDIAVQAENAIKPNGKAHFSVYEGTGKGEGKVTTKGYQRNEKTQAYVPLIEQVFGEGNVTRKGKIITATKNVQGFSEGGMAIEEQMAMNFGDVPDNTVGQDPVSGNDIPMGSTAENVRDDVPAMLSEGEIVVPADVVNFHGVKLFEDLRAEAKMGYAQMAQDGRMGGEPMEMDEDDIGLEFADLEIMIMPDEDMEEEPAEMFRGGMNTERGRGSIYKSYSAPKSSPRPSSKPQRTSSSTAQANRQAAASRSLFRDDDDRPSRPAPKPVSYYSPEAISARVQARKDKPKNNFEKFLNLFRDDDSASEARAKRLERVRLESQPPTSDDERSEGTILEQINFGGDYDKEYEVTPKREKRKKAPTIQEDLAKQAARDKEKEKVSYRYPEKGFAESFMEGLRADMKALGFDEGGMATEPFYDQKGGFGELDFSGIQAREYMNDQGQKIIIMFKDGVPLTPIPDGYYPVAATVTPDVDSTYNVDTINSMTGGGSYADYGGGAAASMGASGDGSDPGTHEGLNMTIPTPVNYEELSLDELRDMLEDQGSMKQKGILAAASAINPVMALAVRFAMYDTARKTKKEIERRLASGDTSNVDKQRYTNMLEIAEREKPSLIDRLTGKAFEKEYSQIPTPKVPDVDYSDPTLAPDQGIYEALTEPYTPEVTTPAVTDPDSSNLAMSPERMKRMQEIIEDTDLSKIQKGLDKTGPTNVTIPIDPTSQTTTAQIQTQRDNTRDAGRDARQVFEAYRNNPRNSKDVANNSAAIQRTDNVIRDMERGVQRGFEKGGLASKKKARKKKSK